jgi:hypothetical protein
MPEHTYGQHILHMDLNDVLFMKSSQLSIVFNSLSKGSKCNTSKISIVVISLEGGRRGKMANIVLTFVVVLCFLATIFSFNFGPSSVSRNVARKIKMEYIPDGISKEKVREKISD